MKIRRILISQPQPATDKSPFSELSAKHNLEIDFFPFITIEGVLLREFRAQRVDILDHTAVIFTSRTAVDH
ncbi:MAG: uroporphyrinogen-III synthase, partial [Mucinivorans sp.]